MHACVCMDAYKLYGSKVAATVKVVQQAMTTRSSMAASTTLTQTLA